MRYLALPAFVLLLLTSVGWSETTLFPFHDSYKGSIADDRPVSWLEGGFPATLTATGDDLVLTDPGLILPDLGFSLGLTVVGKDGDLVTDGDSSAQAVFRVNAPNAFGSIYTRSEAGFPGLTGVPEDSDGGAYFGNISGDGVLTVGSFTKLDSIVVLPTELNATERDVVFQLDTIGNTVTASAWYADEQKPESPPTVQYIDDEPPREPGVFGVSFGGFGTELDQLTNVSATFRSFDIVTGLPPGLANNPGLDGRIPPGLADGLPPSSRHAIPEPTSLILVFIGFGGIAAYRRRGQA